MIYHEEIVSILVNTGENAGLGEYPQTKEKDQ